MNHRQLGIDTVGALQGVRHGQCDERLLALRERPLREDGPVPVKELLGQLGLVLANLWA